MVACDLNDEKVTEDNFMNFIADHLIEIDNAELFNILRSKMENLVKYHETIEMAPIFETERVKSPRTQIIYSVTYFNYGDLKSRDLDNLGLKYKEKYVFNFIINSNGTIIMNVYTISQKGIRSRNRYENYHIHYHAGRNQYYGPVLRKHLPSSRRRKGKKTHVKKTHVEKIEEDYKKYTKAYQVKFKFTVESNLENKQLRKHIKITKINESLFIPQDKDDLMSHFLRKILDSGELAKDFIAGYIEEIINKEEHLRQILKSNVTITQVKEDVRLLRLAEEEKEEKLKHLTSTINKDRLFEILTDNVEKTIIMNHGFIKIRHTENPPRDLPAPWFTATRIYMDSKRIEYLVKCFGYNRIDIDKEPGIIEKPEGYPYLKPILLISFKCIINKEGKIQIRVH